VASFPKPLLLCSFDPFGKDLPVLRRGRTGELKACPVDRAGNEIAYREVTSRKHEGKLLARVEYYHDAKPSQPVAARNFESRVDWIEEEVFAGEWATIAFDSLTFFELAARKYAQYTINPRAKDPRKWYGQSTDALEDAFMIRVSSWPCNVVLTAHISEDKDEVHGHMLFNPDVPGRLSSRLPAAYQEFYRAFVSGKGADRLYLLQTRSGGGYNANTQIDAPDPVDNDYKALWSNWKALD